jgi:PAS domain S-box-containing protein
MTESKDLSFPFEAESSGLFFYAVQASPNAIMITNPVANIVYVNPQFTELTGYPPQEVIGKNARILKSDCTDKGVFSTLWSTITQGKVWRGEFQNRRKDGTIYWERASISGFRDSSGTITHYIGIKENITIEKQVQFEREKLIQELQTAWQQVKTLSGLLPICSSCKRIRNDQGYWNRLETYIEAHSTASFSHGICPNCIRQQYPELAGQLGLDGDEKVEGGENRQPS